MNEAAHVRELECLIHRGMEEGVLELERLGLLVDHLRRDHPRVVDVGQVAAILSELGWDWQSVKRVLVSENGAATVEDGTHSLPAPYRELSVFALAIQIAWLRCQWHKAQGLRERVAACPRDMSPAELAFALGVDEETCTQAEETSGGRLRAWLDTPRCLERLHLHAGLSPSVRDAVEIARAEQVIAFLAEMGLHHRPIHLWLGPRVIIDMLSPYTRELRADLVRLLGERQDALAPDLAGEPPSEDVLYALVHDLQSVHPELRDERQAGERAAGVFSGGFFDVVDLGRLELALIDARLSVTLPEPAPVLVRLSQWVQDHRGVGLARLLNAGLPLASVHLMHEGTCLDQSAVIEPRALVYWDQSVVAGPALGAGVVLSAPNVALLGGSYLASLAQRLGVRAVEVGGHGAAATLMSAVACGQKPGLKTSWSVVSTDYAESGRPTLACLRAQGAQTVSILGDLFGEPPKLERGAPPPASRRASAFRIRV